MYIRADRSSRKGFYKGSILAITAFSSAFYSRIICSVTRLPSVLNHLHFLIVPVTTLIILSSSRPRNPRQVAIVWMLLAGLLIFLSAMMATCRGFRGREEERMINVVTGTIKKCK